MIAMGYFLHGLGKVLVPEKVLNKKGRLTDQEFELVKAHSYDLGPRLLEKNLISNAFIANVVKYHHAALYNDEERTYPTGIVLTILRILRFRNGQRWPEDGMRKW